MRRQHRYGDEGTIVTLREQAVAVLFVVGIAALLIGPVVMPSDLPAGTNTQTAAALQVESIAESASRGDDSGRPTSDSQESTP